MKFYENDIRYMVEAALGKLLNEGISSIVYHYTHPSSLLSIIKSNKFRVSDDGGFSVTRQRNDRIGYAVAFRHEFFDGCYARIQLNGDLLNQNFKGTQVDEFGLKDDLQLGDFDNDGDYSNRYAFRTQAEDKVWARNGEFIPNAIKYVERVDIIFLTEDDRYDSCLEEIDEFMNELVSIATGTEWEKKIFFYFDGGYPPHRQDFNFQTKNCMTLSDIRRQLNESVGDDYTIVYRGVGGPFQDPTVPVLWVTDEPDYAESFGDKIKRLAVPNTLLDRLASVEQLRKYVIDTANYYDEYDGEGDFGPYEARNYDIKWMLDDGFSGYVFHEDDCQAACIFKNDAEYKKIREV